MNIDRVGDALEHQGLSDDEIDEFFLEHFGVKGIKWGVRKAEKRVANANRRAQNPDRFGNRNNDAAQRRISRVSRVASGKATVLDQVKAGLFNIPVGEIMMAGGSLRGASANQLDRGARTQRKIVAGKKHTTDVLLRLQGIDIRELDYSYDKSAPS